MPASMAGPRRAPLPGHGRRTPRRAPLVGVVVGAGGGGAPVALGAFGTAWGTGPAVAPWQPASSAPAGRSMKGRALGGIRGMTEDSATGRPGSGTGSTGRGGTGTGAPGWPGAGWLGSLGDVAGEQVGEEPADVVPVSLGDVVAEPVSGAVWSEPPSAVDPAAPLSPPPAATARAPDPTGAAAGGELAGELDAGAVLAALR